VLSGGNVDTAVYFEALSAQANPSASSSPD
jgi:hypothetical protein